MTIRLAERGSTIFVESDVRCACTEDSHISESYSQQTPIRDCLDGRLKEWHCSAIGIQINYIVELFILSHHIHQINSVLSVYYKFY